MNTETVLLSQVSVNKANPRTITDRKLKLLVERLLAFPKMIRLRPIVVDSRMTALGGNMRIRAFSLIAQMSIEEIGETLARTKNFQRLTKAEREKLLQYWQVWLDKPTVEIVRASELSDEEKKEFIIADNASFGQWDYDKLANEWDNDDLASWGVDVWKPDESTFDLTNRERGGDSAGFSPDQQPDSFDPNSLPPELSGVDINPADLPEINGSDETAMERIIIVYPKNRAEDVAKLVGIGKIEKVVYSIEELMPEE